MAPTHMSPRVTLRIILIEHMIDSIVIYEQSIRIIHPILGWCIMELRSESFIIGGGALVS
jgi:hypothetical protein